MSLPNGEQCRKRPRTQVADEFPDEDLTAEEFDACLSQATVAFEAPAHAKFSLDGEVQLLRQRVARLSRELHGERLSRQDELKSQADAYKKQIRELKTQLEFKEHEMVRALPNRSEKAQLVDAATDAQQLAAPHGVKPTYLDVVRNYVNCLRGVNAPPLDGVVLALRSLGALLEAHMFDGLLERLCADETSFFDVLADVLGGGPRESAVIREAIDVIEIIAAASPEAAGFVVRRLRREVVWGLATGPSDERTAERVLRLLRLALECGGDRLFVHSDEATCLWGAVARRAEVSALCEAAVLVQRGSEACDCDCFHGLVRDLVERFRKGVAKDGSGASRRAVLLLNCFCAVADAKPLHQLRVCRLVALCTDLPRCEEAVRDVTRAWDFAVDDREIYLGCDSGRSPQGF